MDILDKLKSQIGDDVQHIFDHEALFKEAADEITALRARLAEVDAERDDARKLQAKDFAVIDSPWKRRAEAAEAALATARRNALEEAAKEIDCGGCYGNPCPRPGDCMQGIANEIRAMIDQAAAQEREG